MRVLVTGSRHWRDKAVIRRAMETAVIGRDHEEHTLVVGGQVSIDNMTAEPYGADYYATEIAKELGWLIEEYPADWEQYGKVAGPIRNGQMVSTGAEVCLAFPTLSSKGTIDCMRRAKVHGIRVMVYSGSVNGGEEWQG